MYGSFDVSTSALLANRTRMNVISANLANKSTLLNADGNYEPYRRRVVEFAEAAGEDGGLHGVRVSSIRLDDAPLQPKHEPGSPHADKDGYVYYPNVSSVVESMNAMEAARSYEANITTIEATKSMVSMALEMLG